MAKFGARVLGLLGGLYGLAISLVYTLVVTRRLPLSDLAVLSVFNAGYGVATSFLGYATTWYPRILAKEPHRISELAAVGLLVAVLAWGVFIGYMWLLGKLHVSVVILGLVLLVLASWPAGAYLSIYQQRRLVGLNYVSQTIKLGGAYLIRLHPSVETVLSINVAMSLPFVLIKKINPNFSKIMNNIKEFMQGIPYQTLYILSNLAGAGTIYVISLAGGDVLVAYNYLLAQAVKAIQPAYPIVSLMYGSLLVARDKLRRALIDGSLILYIYLAVAVVLAKTPEWFIAVIRPSEITNAELINAVKLNSIALVAWGLLFHADTVLRGFEEKPIIGIRDRPAIALTADIVSHPVLYVLTYMLIKTYGVGGLVISSAIASAMLLTYRLILLGATVSSMLLTRLYLPTTLVLLIVYFLPIPLLPHTHDTAITTIVTYIPNATILAAITLLLMATLSPPMREALSILISSLIKNKR